MDEPSGWLTAHGVRVRKIRSDAGRQRPLLAAFRVAAKETVGLPRMIENPFAEAGARKDCEIAVEGLNKKRTGEELLVRWHSHECCRRVSWEPLPALLDRIRERWRGGGPLS